MEETVKGHLQLIQIEILYAELELVQLGVHLPELRRTLEHLVSAKKILGELVDGSDSTRAVETSGGFKAPLIDL
jgi:hypothetical protein